MTELELAIRAVLQEVDKTHPDDRKRIAAACLAGQAFGFTQENINELEHAAELIEGEFGKAEPEVVVALRSIADRIAALLPPETP